MKINKTICLDVGIADLLNDVPNASVLINSLLERHFNLVPQDVSVEELEKAKLDLMAKIGAIDKRKAQLGEADENKQKEKIKKEAEEAKEWEKKKKVIDEKAKIRRKYEKCTPKDEQNAVSWDNFYNAHKQK